MLTTETIDLTLDTVNIETTNTIEVIGDVGVYEPTVQEQESIVEAYKKEYSIVGDGLYAKVTAEEAPQWLLSIIDSVTDVRLASSLADLVEARTAILNAIAEVDIAKNEYQELINIEATVDGIIVDRLQALNATVDQNRSDILQLATTKVDAEQAAAIAATVLTASVNEGAIKAQYDTLQTAVANEESARTTSVTTLTSALDSQSLDIQANATATQALETYTGVTGVSAVDGTTLVGYFTDADGNVGGATSSLINGIYVDSEGNPVSNFEYVSNLYKNNSWYSAGFGLNLTASTGTGTSEDPYDSEFWITADKFKLTTTGYNGPVYSPFNVDGTTGDITFIGKVTFGSGQTGTIDEAIAAVVETVAIGDKNINISDNLIPTTSLVADTNNAGYQFVGTPTKSNAVGIDTFAEPQIVLDNPDEVYSPYVDEMTIAYYYRFGIKGITDLNEFFITLIDSSNNVTYNNVTYTMLDGYTLSDTEWYIVDGIINPAGGNTEPSGSIRLADGTKIATVNNYAIASGSVKLLLGWTFDATISRMKLAKITADTITGAYATTDYVNTTTIDGGRILTNTIDVDSIKANSVFIDHSLQSSDFTSVDGNGFRLKSNAVGTFADPTIYGAYIKGGNIYGTTIEGSSVYVRDLVVLTDADQQTKLAVPFTPTASDWGFRAFNDTSTSTCKLAAESGNIIVFTGQNVTDLNTTLDAYFPGPIILKATITYTNYYRIDIQMLVNNSVTATGSMLAMFGGNTVTTLNGFTFRYASYGSTIAVAIDPTATVESLSGTGAINFQYRIWDGGSGSYSNEWTNMNMLTNVRGIVYNT